LEPVREGQVGQPGVTDFGPGVCRAQKGNNGSRRHYIWPQSAGSWISRSRGVKPSRSVKVPSEQSVKQVIYEEATTKRVVGCSAVGSSQGAR